MSLAESKIRAIPEPADEELSPPHGIQSLHSETQTSQSGEGSPLTPHSRVNPLISKAMSWKTTGFYQQKQYLLSRIQMLQPSEELKIPLGWIKDFCLQHLGESFPLRHGLVFRRQPLPPICFLWVWDMWFLIFFCKWMPKLMFSRSQITRSNWAQPPPSPFSSPSSHLGNHKLLPEFFLSSADILSGLGREMWCQCYLLMCKFSFS